MRYTRKELLEKFIEVEQPPAGLIVRLKENKVIGLGKHILSDYVIRPVACDKLPWNITHINPFNQAQLNRFSRPRYYKRDQQERQDEDGVIKIPKNLSIEE